jgi:hypothetical protein
MSRGVNSEPNMTRASHYGDGTGAHRSVPVRGVREAIVVASRENRLEANADKTQCMVRCGEQNAGHSGNAAIGNGSLGRVEQFRCLGTNIHTYCTVQSPS